MDHELYFNYRIILAVNDLGIDLLSSNELQITSETLTLGVPKPANRTEFLLKKRPAEFKKKSVTKQADGLLPVRCAFYLSSHFHRGRQGQAMKRQGPL